MYNIHQICSPEPRSVPRAGAPVSLLSGLVGPVQVVAPFPDRPTEGFLHFNVELGPMAAAGMGEVCFMVIKRAPPVVYRPLLLAMINCDKRSKGAWISGVAFSLRAIFFVDT